MQNDNKPSYLSIGEASEYLGVSIDTLRRWEKKGRIKAMRSPGGHRYFQKSDLDSLFGMKYARDEDTFTIDESAVQTKQEEDVRYIPQITTQKQDITIPQTPTQQVAQPMPYIHPFQQYAHDVPAPPQAMQTVDQPPAPTQATVSQPQEIQAPQPVPQSDSTFQQPTSQKQPATMDQEIQTQQQPSQMTTETTPPPSILEPQKDESKLSDRQKQLLETILKDEKKQKEITPNNIFLYIVIAIIVLAIINIVILYFWQSSSSIISPVP